MSLLNFHLAFPYPSGPLQCADEEGALALFGMDIQLMLSLLLLCCCSEFSTGIVPALCCIHTRTMQCSIL